GRRRSVGRGRLLGGAEDARITRTGGGVAPPPSEGVAAVIRVDPLDRVFGVAGEGRPHPGRETIGNCRWALAKSPLRLEDVLDHGGHRRRFEWSRSSADLQAAAHGPVAHVSNSTSSTRVPAASAGWTKAILAPRPPIRGVSSMRRAPTDFRWVSAASMSATA